jgi:hypothetical protein
LAEVLLPCLAASSAVQRGMPFRTAERPPDWKKLPQSVVLFEILDYLEMDVDSHEDIATVCIGRFASQSERHFQILYRSVFLTKSALVTRTPLLKLLLSQVHYLRVNCNVASENSELMKIIIGGEQTAQLMPRLRAVDITNSSGVVSNPFNGDSYLLNKVRYLSNWQMEDDQIVKAMDSFPNLVHLDVGQASETVGNRILSSRVRALHCKFDANSLEYVAARC